MRMISQQPYSSLIHSKAQEERFDQMSMRKWSRNEDPSVSQAFNSVRPSNGSNEDILPQLKINEKLIPILNSESMNSRKMVSRQ